MENEMPDIVAGGSDTTIDNDTMLEIYRRTTVIALTDKRMRAMILAGEIRLGYYCVRGQEVLAAAAMTALRKDDYLVTTYRGMHDELAKGVPLKSLWAEYLGRETGTCKGKGGLMHITDTENGVMVTTGIVGSGMPVATGLALASLLRGEDRVTVTCFGDGATNIGAFHEALNLASIWNLPVIFLCQNNQWAEHTPFSMGTSVENVVDRASSYSMRGVKVDGNDAQAMYAAMRDAVRHARAGNGPTLIEAVTYRIMGHTLGSPSSYMPKDYKATAKAADPLPRLRAALHVRGISDADLDAIDAVVQKDVDEAVEFAVSSPFADPGEVYLDVLATEIAA
jgi:acetoin:2,6-dichlorophenolindophenol oxidoreductase subunit alpha